MSTVVVGVRYVPESSETPDASVVLVVVGSNMTHGMRFVSL